MNRTLQRLFTVVFLPTILLVIMLAVPSASMQVRPPADFTAPMSPAEARARIAEAQQAERAFRAEVYQQAPRDSVSADQLPLVQTVYFSPTGQHLSDRTGFLSFWRANGGLRVFGYPISGEIVEDGMIVQYFERARFEYHADYAGTPQQVQLSLLGSQLFGERGFSDGAPEGKRSFFAETGNSLNGRFGTFWEKRGGLPIFGYPISEPFEEISALDGQTRIVQYFERARFEWIPEALESFYRSAANNGLNLMALDEISLGDLGRQAAAQRGHQFAPVAPIPGVPEWSSKLWERRIVVDLSTQYLTAYEGDLVVFRAPVATGRDGFNTPTGSYAIYAKYTRQTMTGSMGGESWYVPNIPWVQYVVGGVALHGTYWHDQWGTGTRMSHGCINVNIDDAQWLWEWSDIGTAVEIRY